MTKLILCSTLIIVGMLAASLRSEPTRVASNPIEGTSPALPVMTATHTTTEETAPNPPSVVSSPGEANALADRLADATESRLAVARQSQGSTGAPTDHQTETEYLRSQLAERDATIAALESENRKLKQFTAVNTVKSQPAMKPQPVRYYYRPQLQYGSCGPGGCGTGRVGIFGRRR